MTDHTDALARVSSGPLVRIDDLRNSIAALRSRANLITPCVQLDHVPAMHGVSLRHVSIDPSPEAGEVYQDKQFCRADERALTKIGLLKLWQAAGGSVTDSRRMDDRADRFYCEWRVAVRLQQLDGRTVEIPGSKTIDFRPGSPQIAGWTAKRLAQARQVIEALAESKALLRAIRAALAVKQKYTTAELEKPFVVPALVPVLDTDDPEIRRMVAAQILGVTTQLYGPPDGESRVDQPSVEVMPEPPDDELPDPDTPEPDPEPIHADHVCACPCGCQRPLTLEQAEAVRAKISCLRCRDCYPAASVFSFAEHEGFDESVSLGIPDRPDITIGSLRDAAKRRAS